MNSFEIIVAISLSKYFVNGMTSDPVHYDASHMHYEPRPRIVCADGFSLSVQASEYNYCTPRKNTIDEVYTAVEVGFIEDSDGIPFFNKDWNEYADERIADTVYGYVPTEYVIAFINKHGGWQNNSKSLSNNI